MSPSGTDTRSTVQVLLRELDALRIRLEQAPSWFSRPQDTLRAGALAEEVRRFCQEASRSPEDGETKALLAEAQRRLDELQILLGPH